MTNDDLKQLWRDPPREHGAIPFWFWNDDLNDDEIIRQIREFHARGFMGFTVHPRVGLSRRIGYQTPEYFRLFRLALDEAKRLGMKVAVTDEASYPSGAAQGKVVAENHAYAQRCLIALHHKVVGPATGYWRPNPARYLADKLLCVVAARETSPDVLDPDTLTIVPHDEHELVRYEFPAGNWRLVACWNVASGSTMRGAFEEEDDKHATAPASADILNPAAVACYIRLTHEKIYENLRDYFGSTLFAIFTDEPGPLSRYPQRGPDPKEYTDGLLDDVQRLWDDDVVKWLPAHWLNCGPRTVAFRDAWKRAVAERLDRVYYEPQGRWCREHGIALTGHPHASNEFAGMRHFAWPGQDMVWRFVAPDRANSALESPDSVASKSATSMAAIMDARYASMETLGAYGWQMTLDEAKWLIDTHLVRGNNLYFLHACFYSIRGRRAYESEPDIGVHNPWWPYFGIIGDYLRRVCWMITDGTLACDVAILSDPTFLAWGAAKDLQQSQIDYLYIDEQALNEATIRDGRLLVVGGGQQFRAVVLDRPAVLSERARAKLDAFGAAGGLVVDAAQSTVVPAIVEHAGRDVEFRGIGDGGGGSPNLRVLHYRKAGREFYFLVNEGEQPIEGDVSFRAAGGVERWEPIEGTVRTWPARRSADGRTHVYLRLERRESAVFCIDPTGVPDRNAKLPASPGEAVMTLANARWTTHDLAGRAVEIPCPGDWSRQRAWETFAGTIVCRTRFDWPAKIEGDVFLDLGAVGDIADVRLNGQPAGVRAWGPYVVRVTPHLRPGGNELEIRVTNSIANRLDGRQSPSGLLTHPILRRAAATPMRQHSAVTLQNR